MEEKNSSQDIAIAEIKKDISYIKETLLKINNKICNDLVTQKEFAPLKELYDKLTSFSLGFIILVGAGVVFLFSWLKDKFLK